MFSFNRINLRATKKLETLPRKHLLQYLAKNNQEEFDVMGGQSQKHLCRKNGRLLKLSNNMQRL
ncbi:hypothetical protein AHAS_Ahas13G0382800 [Arachis hypogaea]